MTDTGNGAADQDRKWYVIHTYSGYENKVKTNLEHRIESMGVQDKIFQVVIPTEEEIEIKDGQRRTVQKKVYPGYVMVEMAMDDDAWYVVRNTPGVTGLARSRPRSRSASPRASASRSSTDRSPTSSAWSTTSILKRARCACWCLSSVAKRRSSSTSCRSKGSSDEWRRK